MTEAPDAFDFDLDSSRGNRGERLEGGNDETNVDGTCWEGRAWPSVTGSVAGAVHDTPGKVSVTGAVAFFCSRPSCFDLESTGVGFTAGAMAGFGLSAAFGPADKCMASATLVSLLLPREADLVEVSTSGSEFIRSEIHSDKSFDPAKNP